LEEGEKIKVKAGKTFAKESNRVNIVK